MITQCSLSHSLSISCAAALILFLTASRSDAGAVAEAHINESLSGYHSDYHEDPALASAAISYTLGSGWAEADLVNGTLKTFVQTSTSDVVTSQGAQVSAYASLDDNYMLNGAPPGETSWVTGHLHVTGTLHTPPGASANWYSGVLVGYGGSWGRDLYPTEGGDVDIDIVFDQVYPVQPGQTFRVYATMSSYGWGWNHNDIQSNFSGTASLSFDLPAGTTLTSEGGYVGPPPLPGDLDGDGFVGLNDLDIVLQNWNQNVPPADARADVNGDGFVGLDDLDAVLMNWNAGTPPNGATNFPEPATIALFVPLLSLIRRRDR